MHVVLRGGVPDEATTDTRIKFPDWRPDPDPGSQPRQQPSTFRVNQVVLI